MAARCVRASGPGPVKVGGTALIFAGQFVLVN